MKNSLVSNPNLSHPSALPAGDAGSIGYPDLEFHIFRGKSHRVAQARYENLLVHSSLPIRESVICHKNKTISDEYDYYSTQIVGSAEDKLISSIRLTAIEDLPQTLKSDPFLIGQLITTSGKQFDRDFDINYSVFASLLCNTSTGRFFHSNKLLRSEQHLFNVALADMMDKGYKWGLISCERSEYSLYQKMGFQEIACHFSVSYASGFDRLLCALDLHDSYSRLKSTSHI